MTDATEGRGFGYPFLDDQQEVAVDTQLADGAAESNGMSGAEGPFDDDAPVDVDRAPSELLDVAVTPLDRASLQSAMNDAPGEATAPFLQNLIDAMRRIAEQTRDDAMAKLRAAVSTRSADIRNETDRRATELRDQADTDVTAVMEWEQGEMQRIRDEAAARVSARTATLESQLSANEAAGEGAMAAAQARIDAFEAEMTAFFTQLDEIRDPAALALALKRIPQPPSLTDAAPLPPFEAAPTPTAAAAPEAEPAAEVEHVAEAQHVVEAEAAPEPAAVAEPADVAEPAVAEPAASAQAAEAESSREEMAVVAAPPSWPAEPPAAATPPAATPAAPPEAAPEAALADVPAEFVGATVTTQVLVTGLTSFGAITSFKQQLEKVDGVKEVSLGLGTSGEFIFTAVHRPGFDLSAAIRSFEETAQFVASNGQLRVTVGAKG